MADDLVTGATGLLGNNLVRALLLRGRRVRVLLRPSPRTVHLDGLPLERVAGDVTDAASMLRACEGVEHVYHCAALVSMWAPMADAMWKVNVGGTDNVLAAVRQAGVRRLIHCSSVDALGLPEGPAPATEETPWNWDRLGYDNGYARSKYESQRRVLAAAAADVDAVVVNPTMMLGAWDTGPSSGQVILGVAAGQGVGWTPGGNNVVDVEDAAEAMITAAERGGRGECYILGHENLTYREIFTRVAEVLGVPAPRFAMPYPLARVGGWCGDAYGAITRKEPRLTSLVARIGWLDHYFSPRKAVEQLGMRQTPVREAIARAVRWFRDMGILPAQ